MTNTPKNHSGGNMVSADYRVKTTLCPFFRIITRNAPSARTHELKRIDSSVFTVVAPAHVHREIQEWIEEVNTTARLVRIPKGDDEGIVLDALGNSALSIYRYHSRKYSWVNFHDDKAVEDFESAIKVRTKVKLPRSLGAMMVSPESPVSSSS